MCFLQTGCRPAGKTGEYPEKEKNRCLSVRLPQLRKDLLQICLEKEL